jgi:hypothetical protein
MERNPAVSYPLLARHDSELEGIYRFLGNPRISMDVLLGGHVKGTRARASGLDTILIAHDTTDFMFGGFSERDGLADLGGGYQGFYAHFSLALSADGTRCPLGVLAQETYVCARTKKATQRDRYQRAKEPAPIYGRWLRCVKASEEAIKGVARPIHLMDRESDSYELFSELLRIGARFVTRVAQNRRLAEYDGEIEYIAGAVSKLDVVFERTVPIGKRRLEVSPIHRKRHPPREERVARLCYSATPVRIKKPNVTRVPMPESLALNLVHVWEVDTKEGDTPIEWTLYTTEPIATVDEIAEVVDFYRARWVIEEFFKSIKTGCRFEDKQLESYHSLKNALALTIPMAWNLLLLRFLYRHQPNALAEEVLSPAQIKILKTLPKRKLQDHATVADAMAVIATWGGHLKQNGPPGWLVLGRGYQRLVEAEEVWNAATQAQNVINH